MSGYSSKAITTLCHKVKKTVAESKDNDLVFDKDRNFSRTSKLGLENTINFVLGLGTTTLNNELERFYEGKEKETVSSSAVIQSRDKIKPELFSHLFDLFNEVYPYDKLVKGYRVLAVDGSDIPISRDEKDTDTFHGGRCKNNGDPGKSYNMFHLNGMYDTENERFIDFVIQGEAEADERLALELMAKRYKGEKAIFIADRGYEASNLFEVLNTLSPNKYLIRVKDIESTMSMFKYKELPEDEFDEDVPYTFTNINTKEYHQDKKKYKVIQTARFDFLNEDNHFYDVNWRVVRVKKSDINTGKDKDSYCLFVTNLNRDEFNKKKINDLYQKRWKIETAFRYLKYSAGLLSIVSRKRNLIKQEIIAKLIMYNVSSVINTYLKEKRISKEKRKYDYQINLDNLIRKIISLYYKRKGGIPPDLDEILSSKLSPVRNDRSFMRNSRPKHYYSSTYRFY